MIITKKIKSKLKKKKINLSKKKGGASLTHTPTIYDTPTLIMRKKLNIIEKLQIIETTETQLSELEMNVKLAIEEMNKKENEISELTSKSKITDEKLKEINSIREIYKKFINNFEDINQYKDFKEDFASFLDFYTKNTAEYFKLCSETVKKTKDTITNIDSIINSSSYTSTETPPTL